MISAADVKELRNRTGAGMMDCKKALEESGGDMEQAIEYLRKKGLATAAKRAGKIASEGLVHAYIHGGGRIGVLIEVNCETDFVAKTDAFKELVHDLAMQVAASRPEYIAREDVPEEVLAKEKEILRAQALNEGKPEKVIDRIVAGRLEKFFQDNCLLEQPFIKDMDRTIQDLINEAVAKLGEKIVVRRFVRYEVGEGIKAEE
ncbi:MAG: elongation factor Ts [Moorella sp. (in: firmicutes)]|jgi:elongation factor Ts|uniref:translation elongation factor Ts n=1 Tax=unclassified Neomoorella TaxID=2676739 RepID=UPI0010FFB6F3|nr:MULTISPECIES: translation elongation factor Ts [unclassified Moorella (in: firmicutes)]MDK2815492.1 elongation factor Ts [Moorella sp. (in: firmicutes)]MDK2894097.1 elongation factor Ts [Moorella sp. (in: firmicutes)]GEA15237.1 elongation factor Ts [Moorella sp. E308F]GEA19902.1 elongation factor Ts [Moorella sp. E306M]